ncbi:AarF/ABC1/UbiB kinase family protein [Candidatus Saccharibacteria bacterium]|nr:AarF/ABC1/UbiB kinase family protein [Candidatus Saccharibacteria bacterium]
MAASAHAKQIKLIKRYRTKTVLAVGAKAYALHRKNMDAEMHNLICDEFTALGGVYIKFLQGVLLKSTMMKNWRSPNRLNIFENLESEPLNIQEILKTELGPDKIKQISAISPEPFAAGSFGQVYYGQHVDGTQIIIKVLRPMIRETLVFDLKLLGIFMKTSLGKVRNMQLDIKQAVEDFKRATLRETDYIEEARFANELYEAYKDNTEFIIPKTYIDLCTDDIIVQEYLPGISVAHLIKLREQGIDIKQYVQEQLNSDMEEQLTIAGVELIYGIFALPRIQGDPHPGNVKLLPDNKIGMIDFGISAQSPKEKAAFYAVLVEYAKVMRGEMDIPALFGQFLRFFVSDLYRALKKITSMLPGDDASNDLTRQMGRVAEKNFKSGMNQDELENIIENGNILTMMNQVVNKGNRFGLVMKITDSEMLRAAQSYITLVDSVGGKTTVIPKMLDIALARVANDFPEYTQDTTQLPTVNRAMETISKWLERVADKDPALFQTFINKMNAAQPQAAKAATRNLVKEPPASDSDK